MYVAQFVYEGPVISMYELCSTLGGVRVECRVVSLQYLFRALTVHRYTDRPESAEWTCE